MKPTWIVSGFMRSGTSMMMHALAAGGLEAAFDAERDTRMNDRWGDGDYLPNPNGFYELAREDYQDEDFPTQYEGKLIKCLWGGMLRLKPGGDYRIVFMRRDPEEIRQSYEAFFDKSAPAVVQQYDRVMERITGILEQRRDVNLTVIRYENLMAEPLPYFEYLARSGWPIDATEAASIPDPDLYRFRLDQLDQGVTV